MVRLLGELACGPETGLEEINADLPEADFWPQITNGMVRRRYDERRRRPHATTHDRN